MVETLEQAFANGEPAPETVGPLGHAGGTLDVSASRALLTVYLMLAVTTAATTFARRDVSG